ncbi:MAG: hypothetical protein C4527_12860 [Candidatus Omnitrophota bacterium]|jgi:hypothetical protein|nr:MAG: hypothetical protein C4527_12860 [Candidatus Omnitrophota bacterium]
MTVEEISVELQKLPSYEFQNDSDYLHSHDEFEWTGEVERIISFIDLVVERGENLNPFFETA